MTEEEKELIELLIADQKKIGDEKELKKGREKPNKQKRYNWKGRTKIYQMLSQHYVQRKSVVFIVDYDTNREQKYMTNEYVKQ